MGARICLVRSREVVANTARWSQPKRACSLRILAIVSAKQRIVALWQRHVGPGCVLSVSGRGGRSCGPGGFGSWEADAGPTAPAALASATAAVATAASPRPRVDFLPGNLYWVV